MTVRKSVSRRGYSPYEVQPWLATATTDSTGTATFTIPAGQYGTPPTVSATVVRNTTSLGSFCGCFVRSVTATSVVVQVWQAHTALISIGINYQSLEAAPAGLSVHLQAWGLP